MDALRAFSFVQPLRFASPLLEQPVPEQFLAPSQAAPGERTATSASTAPRVGVVAAVGTSVFAVGASQRRRRCRRDSTARHAASVGDAFVSWAGDTTKEEDKELVDSLVNAVKVMRADPAAWGTIEDIANAVAANVEKRATSEERTLEEILGPDAMQSVEKSVDAAVKIGVPEQDLQAALRTPAVEKALGAVLKDGIFEFIQNVDFLGKAIDTIPVLGPFRQQVAQGLRTEVEKVLGNQIKGFLGRYSRVAAEKTLLPWLLAKENRPLIGSSAKDMVRYVCQRKTNELVPPAETIDSIRIESLGMMKSIDVGVLEEMVTYGRAVLHTRPDRTQAPAVEAGLKPVIAVLDKQLRRFQDD